MKVNHNKYLNEQGIGPKNHWEIQVKCKRADLDLPSEVFNPARPTDRPRFYEKTNECDY